GGVRGPRSDRGPVHPRQADRPVPEGLTQTHRHRCSLRRGPRRGGRAWVCGGCVGGGAGGVGDRQPQPEARRAGAGRAARDAGQGRRRTGAQLRGLPAQTGQTRRRCAPRMAPHPHKEGGDVTTQQTAAQSLENRYDQLANITPAKGSIHYGATSCMNPYHGTPPVSVHLTSQSRGSAAPHSPSTARITLKTAPFTKTGKAFRGRTAGASATNPTPMRTTARAAW